MRTVIFPRPGEVELVERPPVAPLAGEVLLRVERVGLCGSDLNAYLGENARVPFPRVPGHEFCATVMAHGPGVSGAPPAGARVAVSPYTNCGHCSACRAGRDNACRDNRTLGVQRDGALTEFVAVPAGRVFASARLDDAELALVEPLTIGFHAVERGGVTAADTVAVIGCGGVGHGAVLAAARRGARVLAVDIAPFKLELARALGAAEGVDAGQADTAGALRALTGGEGPSVVIEAAGLAATTRAALAAACHAGRVVLIGYVKGETPLETRLAVEKELDVRGSRNATPADYRAAVACLEAGGYPAGRVVTRTVGMDGVAEALRAWRADRAAVMKIHVRVTRPSPSAAAGS